MQFVVVVASIIITTTLRLTLIIINMITSAFTIIIRYFSLHITTLLDRPIPLRRVCPFGWIESSSSETCIKFYHIGLPWKLARRTCWDEFDYQNSTFMYM